MLAILNSKFHFISYGDSIVEKVSGALYELLIIPLILAQFFFFGYAVYRIIKSPKKYIEVSSLLVSLAMIVWMVLLK